MANMSYCRFRNTLMDLNDCYENMDEEVTDSEEEKARLWLIKMCRDLADDFGHELED